MEELPDCGVLQLDWRGVEAVRRECNMADTEHIRQGIQLLHTWYEQQPHFTKPSLDERFTERVLLLARGSLEVAKQKIDAIAAVRAALPEFYSDRELHCEDFARLHKIVRVVALPRSLPDLTRPMLVRLGSQHREDANFDPLVFYRYLLLIQDNRMYLDYVAGDTYILDLQHFTISDFATFSLTLMKKVYIITSAYGVRLKGIHFINAPSYIDKVIFVLKQGLKEKIANRMQVHSTLDKLYEYVPRECLPSDYGGSLASLEELHEGWLSFLDTPASRRRADDAGALLTDEARRVGAHQHSLGVPGSFRTLSVD